MPKMRFTDDRVRKLKRENFGGAEHIWHQDIPGFGIRIRDSGRTTYVVHYRFGGRSIPYTLGPTSLWRAADATTEAQKILAQVKLGRDPQAEKHSAQARAAETFEGIAEQYLEHAKLKLRPRSFDEVERHLKVHFSALGKKSIHSIDQKQAAGALEDIMRERGPGASDRARASAIGLFSWAIKRGVAEKNPFAGTGKFDLGEARERVLSDDEIRDVWLNAGGDDYGKIVKLLLLTIARRDEIGHLVRSEVDFEKKLWTLPKERAKNHTEVAVPLSPAALKLLSAVEAREESDYFFGAGSRGFQGWSRAKAALDRRIAEGRKARGQQPMEPWVLHDLRRTGATRMGDIGVLPHVVEACLNHISGSKGGVAGIYNRAGYASEMRAAFEAWDSYVDRIVRGETNVISFRQVK